MIRILVSNDDGITAEGLRSMVLALSKYAEVYVAAPSQQQSAKARSLSYRVPITVEKQDVPGAVEAYAVGGTPADCVMWSIDKHSDEFKFDYVFSGINHGSNCGMMAYYSGTVAAAMEASVHGIKSVAMSVDKHDACHFDYICGLIPQLLEMRDMLPVETVLNVNAPNIPMYKVKGVKLIDIAPQTDDEGFYFKEMEDGTYKMLANVPEFEEENLKTDFGIMSSGYVSISPIRARLNDPDSLALLRGMSTEGSICLFLNVQEKKLEEMTHNESGFSDDRIEDRMAHFRDRLNRFGMCVNRVGMPALVSEQYGMGKTISEITDNLDSCEVVEKDGLNLFSDMRFVNLVASSRERRVVLAGAESFLDIRSAAKQFLSRGFDVTVLEDCCISAKDDNHRIAIENMRADGCRIENLETFMIGYVEETGHPAKRRIREILSK